VGWRASFAIFGGIGVVWAVAFYRWFRDDPAQHPAVNAAERQLIAASSGPAPLGEHHPPVPWRRGLTSATLWLMGALMNCGAFVSYLYYSWYPKYLQAARGVPEVASGWLASVVLIGGAVGGVLGGYLTGWVVRRTGNRRWSRCGIGCAG